MIVRGVEGKGYILGNPHTHLGRMTAWFDRAGAALHFSKEEIVEASELARVWIDGFLAGSEPSPESMFGEGIHETDDQDSRLQRWRDAIRVYRKTGYWDHAPWHLLMPFPPDAPLPEMVWTVRGDEVWIWDRQEWTVAEPQPPRQGERLTGTVCDQRDGHDMSMRSTVHAVCDDCGYTSHVVPSGYSLEEWEIARHRYAPQSLPDDNPR